MIEETIIELYPSDLIQSPVHLSVGQEAAAVGVCTALEPDDWLFSNYRGHAHYLARGAPLPEFFAELMGRVTGLSKGKAGSMHLAAPMHGIMGASAVVASTIPHAVGAALAAKITNDSSRIYVAVFGDGAMEQGAFFESLNFAALKGLPVLFVCEDNNFAVHAAKKERQAFEVGKLLRAFGIEDWITEEGYDPVKVLRDAQSAAKHVRTTRTPAFLTIRTMRYQEHVGPGSDLDAGYRDRQKFDAWRSLDPLTALDASYFVDRQRIKQEISSAVNFAMTSPAPDFSQLATDVF